MRALGYLKDWEMAVNVIALAVRTCCWVAEVGLEGKCMGEARRLHNRAGLVKAGILRLPAIIHHVLCGLLAREPSFNAFDQHVRLSEGEWVDIVLWVEVGKSMVDETMSRLVGTNGIDDVEKSCIRAEAPVVDGDGWGGHAGPLGDSASLHVVDQMRTVPYFRSVVIRDYYVVDHALGVGSLFFQYADEAVAGLRGDQL